jgi:hypothetical protein
VEQPSRYCIGTQTLNATSVGTVELSRGQSLTTQNGKVEILLTPGVFVRLGDNGSATMISSGLTDTRMSIDEGEALVEVAEIHSENDLRILEDGKSTELLKVGLYDFNEGQHVVRVLDGKAIVDDGDRRITVKGGHMVNFAMTEPIKDRKFDKKTVEAEDLYRWTSLRSGYLAEANADVAPDYSLGFGWSGEGWYWDPWFDAFTFMPGDGIFYSSFGWGFYSPWCAGYAPFYGGHYFHRFGAYNAMDSLPITVAASTTGHVIEVGYSRAGSAAVVLAAAVFMVLVGDSMVVAEVGSTAAEVVEAATTSIGFIR